MRTLALALALALPVSAGAVDNSKHLFGLGFNSRPLPTSSEIFTPAISVRWIPAAKVELAYLVAFEVRDGRRDFVTLGNQVQYVLVGEDMLNLSALVGVAFTFGDVPFQFDYSVGAAVELFLNESKNLGFLAQFGVGGNHRGRPWISTFGSPLFALGLHYYF